MYLSQYFNCSLTAETKFGNSAQRHLFHAVMCRYVLLKTRAFKASPEKNVATNQLLSQKSNYGFQNHAIFIKSYKFIFLIRPGFKVELMAKCFIPSIHGNTYNMV